MNASLINWRKLLIRCWPVLFFSLVVLAGLQQTGDRRPPCETGPARPIQQANVSIKPLWTRCFFAWPDKRLFLHNDSLLLADDLRHEVASYDVLSGDKEWSFPLENLKIQMGGLILDEGRDRLYAGATDWTTSRFYGLDLSTGAMLWEQHTGVKPEFYPALLADQRLIGIGSSTYLAYTIDPNTGVYEQGTTHVPAVVHTDGHSWEIRDGLLTGVNALTGEVFWQATEASYEPNLLRDVQRNDQVILSARYNLLIAYDVTTKRILWRAPDLKIIVTPFLFQDTIYALGLDARLHLLDAATGAERGVIQFEPAAPGLDGEGLNTDGISGSQLTANDEMIAIYFADTHLLSMYQIKHP